MKKFEKLKSMTGEEITAQLDKLYRELFEARFKKATHQLEDTAIFRRMRHEIAQLKTLQSQQAKQKEA